MSLPQAKHWLQKIHDLEIPEKIKIMNVCGGHERTISRSGIRSLLPENIELIPGPGCPICICPEEDIFLAIQLALNEDVILLAFGDMLRVPVNVGKKEVRSLEQARANGADIRPIASPVEAVSIAGENSGKKIIFFAAGFETTTAPVAAMMAEGLPDNLFILLSGRRTWPAVALLLKSCQPGFDALVAPGHVSTVMGPEEWRFVADKHDIPIAIAGFEPASMLAALYSVLRQKLEGRIFLDNCYQEVVHEGGNVTARRFLSATMNITDSSWRGIGIIPESGFSLRQEYDGHDARLQFKDYSDDTRRRIGEMPPGCDCAGVVLGKIYPDQCRLYGTACKPEAPVGPCMVSDEGACHIWWLSNRHRKHHIRIRHRSSLNVMSLAQQLSQSKSDIVCFHIVVTGFVQGVGFRPFVFRLANELAVKGYVSNNTGQVTIIAEANRQTLETFCQRLINDAPANAQPVIQLAGETARVYCEDFSIKQSNDLIQGDIHILPDLATCDQCLEELFDKHNRRYLYPFINCSQCGPRHSIISSLPYDRDNTAMREFKLCRDCAREYHTPTDRRFHAEPIACEACGPVLSFVDDTHNITDNKLALEACIAALKQGRIVAIKGIGGYHLMCDATSVDAIKLLRRRKQRPDKPFAILMEPVWLDRYVDATAQERTLLQQVARPVVLIKRKPSCKLPAILAPGFANLGVMLPGNPLQHLLCHYFRRPLVATSANNSAEPIISTNADATKRLAKLCDAFLHNNRAIVRPADDPVMMQANYSPQVLRTGRGLAPVEFTLPFTLQAPVLAVGGHIKNTIALAWRNRLVISAHNGNLGKLRSYQTFQRAINDLQRLYQVKAERIICDAHPDYGSSRWADKADLAVSRIYHHHAHASGLELEFPQRNHWLVFTWDGVGLGDDGSLWGGETFFGCPGNWQRIASFKPFRLPGGDKTSREAWRVAASLCWHAGVDLDTDSHSANQLKIIWETGMNCPQSTAAGRLFSAAASLLGLLDCEGFEGHGPMLLEALAGTTQADAIRLPMNRDANNITRIDWQALVMMLKDKTFSTAYRARCFHETLAGCISRICLPYSAQYGDLAIGLSGGVFQNQLLVRLIQQRLHKHMLDLHTPASIPVNDGGLCAGQVIEYHYQ